MILRNEVARLTQSNVLPQSTLVIRSAETISKGRIRSRASLLRLMNGVRDICTPGNTQGSRNTTHLPDEPSLQQPISCCSLLRLHSPHHFVLVTKTFERKIFVLSSSSQEEKQRHDHHRKFSVLENYLSSYSRLTTSLNFMFEEFSLSEYPNLDLYGSTHER